MMILLLQVLITFLSKLAYSQTEMTAELIPPSSFESPYHRLLSHCNKNTDIEPFFYKYDLPVSERPRIFREARQAILFGFKPHGPYLMPLYFGTEPRAAQLGVFDTASRFTWYVCAPCPNCASVSGSPSFPGYNPDLSSTYRPMYCEDDVCDPEYRTYCSPVTARCRFHIDYMGNYSVDGTTGYDDVRIRYNTSILIPAYPFGCRNVMDHRRIPGVIGATDMRTSLPYQILRDVSSKFSFCISTIEDAISTVNFGDKAKVTGNVTALLPQPEDHPYYYIKLEGLLVGSYRLAIPENAFDVTPNGEKGFLVDTGSSKSYLIDEAFQVLRTRLIDLVGRIPRRYSWFHACFFDIDIRDLPPMTFLINNVSLEFPVELLWDRVGPRDRDRYLVSDYCLNIVSHRRLSMLGASHLRGVNVGIDFGAAKEMWLEQKTCPTVKR